MSEIREAIDEVLGPVNHGDGLHMGARIPDASDLGHYFQWDDKCKCHMPIRGPLPLHFLGFALGTDTLEVATNRAPASSRGWLVDQPKGVPLGARDPPYSAAESKWANELLTAVARKPRASWGYDLIVTRRDGQPRIFASRSMPTVRGDTIIYAAEYSAGTVEAALRRRGSANDLLPPSLVVGRSDSNLVDIQVTDAGGEPLFISRGGIRWVADAESKLPESFGGLTVRAQLRPQVADAMLIGGTPKSRVPLLVVLLLLSIGLTVFAAVLLRREVRFAAERADFVANVSHELRTPLTQVRLVLDTLRLGREGDAAARESALGIADREVLRLQHLVEGVLRFTRGPRRNDSPSVRTDVVAEARAVAKEFQPLASPRDVTVAVTGDGAVMATVQQGALRQLLLNLFDNAVKYGREKSTVTAEVTPREGGGARIAVSDEGPGVAPADRDRIWRAFERGSAAKNHAAGGSGIGLTIVRQIAEEHGGRAWVEDAPGGGARFVIDLPDMPA
jgi:signal transduction histidine kinase